MDMSKLPRLSQTDAPPPPSAEEAAPRAAAPQPVLPYEPAGGGAAYAAEAWIAAIVGIIFVLLGRTFGSYLLSLIAHKPFHTGVIFTSSGQEVPYPQLQGHTMVNDAGMFLFGLAMLLDAVVIATAKASPRLRKPLLGFALLITGLAVLFNAYVAAVFFKDGMLPLFSLLAVGIGGYSGMLQWAMFKTVPAPARR